MTSQPRHAEPFPLGTDELPYSKGLTARALIAVGVPTIRAHELARKIEEVVLWRPQGGALEGTPNKWVRSGDPR